MLNLTNKKFGKLTAVKPVGNNKRGSKIWLCKCECGNTKEIVSSLLKSGNTKSCGCIMKSILENRNTVHGLAKKNRRLYNIWCRMRQRCNNSNSSDYDRYGGRGIDVCAEWSSFRSFYNWAINNGYESNLSIDRIDNNGNYQPSNCRWATNIKQARNKRNNHLITYKGETKTLAEWSQITGLDGSLIRYRLKHWDKEKIFNN